MNNQDYEERIRKLRENRVLLDPKPLDRGLPYLLDKISEVNTAREFAIDFLIEAMENKTKVDEALENTEMEYKMEYQGVMANDNDVKTQKSADLRASLANVKVAELALRVHHAKIETYVADGYLSIVKYFYEKIQKVSDNLDQQISLVKLHYEQQRLNNGTNTGD